MIVGFQPFAGGIFFVVAQVDLHIFKTEPGIGFVDKIRNFIDLFGGDGQAIAVPGEPAYCRFAVTQFDVAAFCTNIGKFFQPGLGRVKGAGHGFFGFDSGSGLQFKTGKVAGKSQFTQCPACRIAQHIHRAVSSTQGQCEGKNFAPVTQLDRTDAAEGIVGSGYSGFQIIFGHYGFCPGYIFGPQKHLFPVFILISRSAGRTGNINAAAGPAAAAVQIDPVAFFQALQYIQFNDVAAAQLYRPVAGIDQRQFGEFETVFFITQPGCLQGSAGNISAFLRDRQPVIIYIYS